MRIYIALATQNSKGMHRAVHFNGWLDNVDDSINVSDAKQKVTDGHLALIKVFNGECTEAAGRITADELYCIGVNRRNHYNSDDVWELFELMYLLARSKRQLYLACSTNTDFFLHDERVWKLIDEEK